MSQILVRPVTTPFSMLAQLLGPGPAGVAIAAVHRRDVAQIDGMFKWHALRAAVHRRAALQFGDDRVTHVALLRDRLPVGRNVVAVVAAKAAAGEEVPN